MKRILGLVFGLLLISPFLAAQGIDEGCIQNGNSACIDWNQGIVIAEGIGAPSKNATNAALRNASAQRAARLDAARNILEMIKGINLSSETTMQDAMVSNDTIRTRIRGHLHGLQPVGQPRYFSDGTIKIRMEARILRTIPDELIFRQSANVAPPTEVFIRPTANNTASPKVNTNQVYTGMIIDARDLDLQPAMSPKIFDEEGSEVYGSAYVDRDFVVKHGMAGYAKDMDKAQANDRIKGSPLIIKALGSTGKNRTNVVIKNSDAQALRQIASTQAFLREARVVFLL